MKILKYLLDFRREVIPPSVRFNLLHMGVCGQVQFSSGGRSPSTAPHSSAEYSRSGGQPDLFKCTHCTTRPSTLCLLTGNTHAIRYVFTLYLHLLTSVILHCALVNLILKCNFKRKDVHPGTALLINTYNPIMMVCQISIDSRCL